MPGLERLDVVATDGTLAGAAHERIHTLLPSIEEVRADSIAGPAPRLVVEPGGATAHTARDREDEVAGFARRAKAAVRRGETSADRVALVVQQPLPYVYVAREIFRAGGLPFQMFDALPLAAEPYAAALDLVFTAVSSSFARGPAVALMRSPHFRWSPDGDEVSPPDVAALDRALSEAGYLGPIESLEALLSAWQQQSAPPAKTRAASRAGATLAAVARELVALRSPAPTDQLLTVLIDFLAVHERAPDPSDPFGPRERRARGAIRSILEALREAFERFDSEPVDFDEVAALVRRRIGSHTFAPRTGETGVHLIDADSARFGEFDVVQLAGLVDGEWPERPRRNIFYSPEILRELGWPSINEQRQAARSRFVDLLGLPSSRIIVSTFSLEGDAIVEPVGAARRARGLWSGRGRGSGADGPHLRARGARPRADHSRRAAAGCARLGPPPPRPWRSAGRSIPRFHRAAPRVRLLAHGARALSGLPVQVLLCRCARGSRRIPRTSRRSRRERGAGSCTRCCSGFSRRGTPAVAVRSRQPGWTPPVPCSSRWRRRCWIGSAMPTPRSSACDCSDRPSPWARWRWSSAWRPRAPLRSQERWLEYRLEGAFSLGVAGAQVPLRGVADRIDLLADRRLRVIDYKSGQAPDPKRALQAPIYALCAAERLEARDGRPWTVDEASYVALAGRRASVPVVERGGVDGQATLDAARSRLLRLLDGIHRGEFPPRPHDPMICRFCAFSTVCRKDYVADA